MKNRLHVVLILGLIGCHFLSAGAETGVVIGANLSKYSSEHYLWENQLGFSFGAYNRFKVSKDINLILTILYNQVGSSLDVYFNYASDRACFKQNLHWIELPILFHVLFFRNKKIKPFVQLGGYGAYILAAREYMEYSGQSNRENVIGEVNRLNYGLIAGIGIDFKIGKNIANISFQYRYSLRRVNTSLVWNDRKLSGLQLNIGFGLTKSVKTGS